MTGHHNKPKANRKGGMLMVGLIGMTIMQYAVAFSSSNARRQCPCSTSTMFMTTAGNNNEIPTASTQDNDGVQTLLDKAAQIRAEIAAMEGKTVEEVEMEAQQKRKEKEERKLKLEEEKKNASSSRLSNEQGGRAYVDVPNTPEEMIKQASNAVERAYRDGITRQTVRFALVREDQYITGEGNQWPGGAQQMYREAGKHLTTSLLKEIRVSSSNDEKNKNRRDIVMPPTIKEQDIWDFDGSAIHTAEASQGPEGDVQALVFPNTDTKYINDIDTIDQGMGDRLFLLINPFWRNLDSWGINLLAPGAKKKAQEIIFEKGYNETYVLNRYSVRGEQCAAVKVYPYDWQLFAFREDDDFNNGSMEFAVRLGSSETEPTSAQFTELLNNRPEFQDTRNMRNMKKMF